ARPTVGRKDSLCSFMPWSVIARSLRPTSTPPPPAPAGSKPPIEKWPVAWARPSRPSVRCLGGTTVEPAHWGSGGRHGAGERHDQRPSVPDGLRGRRGSALDAARRRTRRTHFSVALAVR